jgi:hypothetical protein
MKFGDQIDFGHHWMAEMSWGQSRYPLVTKNYFGHLGCVLGVRMATKIHFGYLQGCLGFKMVSEIHFGHHEINLRFKM